MDTTMGTIVMIGRITMATMGTVSPALTLTTITTGTMITQAAVDLRFLTQMLAFQVDRIQMYGYLRDIQQIRQAPRTHLPNPEH
ncbi:hypothetical protein J6590_065286 [Homalodisca vitripennis]|nr:hypothetical protein J6590_065286 [Homalodisca vitripennis]